jgi:DNA-3-methyladenine glycosylase II
VRGLARPDSLPVGDIGIQDAVGTLLGDGRRVSAAEVARLFEPFRPYRGLAAFYLLVHKRLPF